MLAAKFGKRLVIGVALASLVAACTGGATPAPTGPLKVHMQLTPSHVSVAIADDQGFYKGVDIDCQMVGYGESSQLFHAGTDPIGNESPWEAATYQGQGKDIRYFSTVEATTFYSGIMIRTADKAKYPDLKSLKGQKVGIPGFGTGTWAGFQTIAKGLNGLNAKTDFQIVEGNPGDLQGLLQTKSIEAMITFSAPTATALASPDITMIYSVYDEWKKAHGSELPINGWIADSKFLDANLEAMKSFIAGTQQGLDYYKNNLSVAHKGGKYEAFGTAEGRLASAVTTKSVDDLTKSGKYLLDAKTYNKAWAEGVYKFIQMGEGVLLTDDLKTTDKDESKAPTIDKVFFEKLYQ
jgi:ABC-type nitrate/sulfonate/bicarbonate transport system substrate-binding protein